MHDIVCVCSKMLHEVAVVVYHVVRVRAEVDA